MNKVVANADEAIRDVFDGASIMIGGFGLCGMPENLIRALARKGTMNLRTISNNVGIDGVGNGLLLAAGQIVHHIGTYVGENRLLEEMVLKGTIRLDLVPQGTFLRADSRGGRGDSGVLYADGRGDDCCRGQRDAGVRWAYLRDGARADGRLCVCEGMEGRSRRKFDISKNSPEF